VPGTVAERAAASGGQGLDGGQGGRRRGDQGGRDEGDRGAGPYALGRDAGEPDGPGGRGQQGDREERERGREQRMGGGEQHGDPGCRPADGDHEGAGQN
jgi:hypothetical protein